MEKAIVRAGSLGRIMGVCVSVLETISAAGPLIVYQSKSHRASYYTPLASATQHKQKKPRVRGMSVTVTISSFN